MAHCSPVAVFGTLLVSPLGVSGTALRLKATPFVLRLLLPVSCFHPPNLDGSSREQCAEARNIRQYHSGAGQRGLRRVGSPAGVPGVMDGRRGRLHAVARPQPGSRDLELPSSRHRETPGHGRTPDPTHRGRRAMGARAVGAVLARLVWHADGMDADLASLVSIAFGLAISL